jgi:hypothetical protein
MGPGPIQIEMSHGDSASPGLRLERLGAGAPGPRPRASKGRDARGSHWPYKPEPHCTLQGVAPAAAALPMVRARHHHIESAVVPVQVSPLAGDGPGAKPGALAGPAPDSVLGLDVMLRRAARCPGPGPPQASLRLGRTPASTAGAGLCSESRLRRPGPPAGPSPNPSRPRALVMGLEPDPDGTGRAVGR